MKLWNDCREADHENSVGCLGLRCAPSVDFTAVLYILMLGISESFYPDFCSGTDLRGVPTLLEELVNDGKIIRPAYKFCRCSKDCAPAVRMNADRRFWKEERKKAIWISVFCF